MPAATTVFAASEIVTLNRSLPRATHVAVRDGRILGYGGPEIVAAFGGRLDERFATKVIVPGFVEGHGHAADGIVWRNPYVGFYPRFGPDGRKAGGFRSIAEVVAHLREEAAKLPDPTTPLTAWGFDPIYFDGPRMTAADLDAISSTRMIVIGHVSGHIMNVNSKVLAACGFSRDSNLDGLLRDAQGDLTGELLGPAVMGRAARVSGDAGLLREMDAAAYRTYGQIARRVGVTTSTDLSNACSPGIVEALTTATGEADFPIRIVPAMRQREYSIPDGLARIADLKRLNTDKLHFGIVKITADGSIQGFTGRLRWPGYHNGAPNGLWYVAPAELEGIVAAYHEAGVQLHIHTNGDEASEVATEMIGRALARHPRPDHRHTLQHCQMADEATFRRMAGFGMCVNLFANHVFYWGEQHAALTMGPSRALRLDACATALAAGVPLAIHSDTPVTPVDPLFTMWCAVNRLTPAGRVLGEGERITAAQALHAVTLGAAYTLKLDHAIGSIDVGKFADFAVLDHNPLTVAPEGIKDIGVHATLLGGEVFPRQ
ncbi:MAG: amidohydrolase [Acetobacteraceae bacterium]|nr:amidohydrolase [Acetobacteraceae bacterium]